jgi:hypothetical protein
MSQENVKRAKTVSQKFVNEVQGKKRNDFIKRNEKKSDGRNQVKTPSYNRNDEKRRPKRKNSNARVNNQRRDYIDNQKKDYVDLENLSYGLDDYIAENYSNFRYVQNVEEDLVGKVVVKVNQDNVVSVRDAIESGSFLIVDFYIKKQLIGKILKYQETFMSNGVRYKFFKKVKVQNKKKGKVVSAIDDLDLTAFSRIKCDGCYTDDESKTSFYCHSSLRSFAFLIDILYLLRKEGINIVSNYLILVNCPTKTSVSMKYLINYLYTQNVEMCFVGGDYHLGKLFEKIDDVFLSVDKSNVIVLYDEMSRFDNNGCHYIRKTKMNEKNFVSSCSFCIDSVIESDVHFVVKDLIPNERYGRKNFCGSVKKTSLVYPIIKTIELLPCNTIKVDTEKLYLMYQIEQLTLQVRELRQRKSVRMIKYNCEVKILYLDDYDCYSSVEAFGHAASFDEVAELVDRYALRDYSGISYLTAMCGSEVLMLSDLGVSVVAYEPSSYHRFISEIVNKVQIQDFNVLEMYERALSFINLSYLLKEIDDNNVEDGYFKNYFSKGCDNVKDILDYFDGYDILVKTDYLDRGLLENVVLDNYTCRFIEIGTAGYRLYTYERQLEYPKNDVHDISVDSEVSESAGTINIEDISDSKSTIDMENIGGSESALESSS